MTEILSPLAMGWVFSQLTVPAKYSSGISTSSRGRGSMAEVGERRRRETLLRQRLHSPEKEYCRVWTACNWTKQRADQTFFFDRLSNHPVFIHLDLLTRCSHSVHLIAQ